MTPRPPRKKGTPSQAAALPFFFFALVTFLLDLPVIVPLMVLTLGIIVWKNQRDAIARAKLPPIPPPASPGNDELSADHFGRTLEPLPYESSAPPTAPVPEAAPPVLPPPWQLPPTASRDEAAVVTPKPSSRRTRTEATKAQPEAMPRGLLPNLRSGSALRQAIATMTVIGPPRALDPFEPEPRRRPLP